MSVQLDSREKGSLGVSGPAVAPGMGRLLLVLFAAALVALSCAAPPVVVTEGGETVVKLGAYTLNTSEGFEVVFSRAGVREGGLSSDIALLKKGAGPSETVMAFVYIKAPPGQNLPGADISEGFGEKGYDFKVNMPVSGLEGEAVTYVAKRELPGGERGEKELVKNFTWYRSYPATMYRIDIFQRFEEEPEPGPSLQVNRVFREGLVEFHDHCSGLLKGNLAMKMKMW